MRLNFIVIVFLGLFVASQADAQQKKQTAAVLDLTSADLSKNEITNLTNRFRSLLSQTQAFDLIERDKMTAIFNEQNFAVSDNCNSAECAVEIGKVLSAEIMFAGDIGKMGQTYIIDIRMIDVTTGKILLAKTEDYKGDIEGLLGVMRLIANEFAGIKTDGRSKGTVIVSSEETFGTARFIMPVDGVTPVVNGIPGNPVFSKDIKLNLPAGPHKIKFTKSGYAVSKEFNVIVKENEEIIDTVQMTEDKGSVAGADLSLTFGIVQNISSSPSGAKIFDGDVELGVTTLSGAKLSVGPHTLILRKPKYHDVAFTVDIKEGLNPTLPVKTLAPNFGTLKIASVPAGARIKINGLLKPGATPQTFPEFQSGKYEVEIERDRYFSEKLSLDVKDLQTTDTTVTLRPQFADVTITSTPPGATVYLDNDSIGVTPLSCKGEKKGILAGKYSLRLSMKTYLYDDYEDALIVKAGEPVVKTFELKSNFGTVKINTDMTGYKALINGVENKELSRSGEAKLKPGTYEIELIKPKHYPVKKTVSVTNGSMETMDVKFTPQQGRIIAYSVPDGAEFTMIDEKGIEIYKGKAFDRQELVGTYIIKAKLEGYGKIKEKTIRVTEGFKDPVEFTFTDEDKKADLSDKGKPVITGGLTQTTHKPLGGPKNAFLSVLLPGLGGHFVEENKARPILTTVAAGGLMVYGIMQKSKADDYYYDYKKATTYSEVQSYYKKANDARHTYIITTRIGAAIWVADIIYVAYKGMQNQKQNRTASNNGWKINYCDNQVQVGYVIELQ